MIKSFVTWILLSTVVIGLSSCSNDDDSKVEYSLSPTEMILECNYEKRINILPSQEGFEFSSDNSSVASVDIVGKVSANCSGETYINAVNVNAGFIGKCKVAVVPSYSMYRDPCLNFGCSRSEVEAYEMREFAGEGDNGNLIGYRGENENILMVTYMFKEEKLYSVILLCPYTAYVQEHLYNHLKQRYLTQFTNDGTVLVATDKKTGGLLEHYRMNNTNFSRVFLFPYKN